MGIDAGYSFAQHCTHKILDLSAKVQIKKSEIDGVINSGALTYSNKEVV